MNFEGSAPVMEPHGTLQLFQCSLQFNLRYTHLISDGDSETFSLLSRMQPYGADHPIEKLDCVGHVQKDQLEIPSEEHGRRFLQEDKARIRRSVFKCSTSLIGGHNAVCMVENIIESVDSISRDEWGTP